MTQSCLAHAASVARIDEGAELEANLRASAGHGGIAVRVVFTHDIADDLGAFTEPRPSKLRCNSCCIVYKDAPAALGLRPSRAIRAKSPGSDDRAGHN